MQNIDNMEIIFRNEAQRQHYEALFKREMALTKYHDGPTMSTLGIRESVHFMLNQIGWDSFAVTRRYCTYHKLTLEFLSSFFYDLNRGTRFNRGLRTFRMFEYTCRFNQREMTDLLGFPSDPDVFTKAQEDKIMDNELGYFRGSISGNSHPEPNSMDSNSIHNPTIKYFHMILAYTLFGKQKSITSVSRDELFIIFCVFQYRPINATTFMLYNLDRIGHATHEPILIWGLVTMIVADIGLKTPLSHLTPLGGIRPVNIVLCFNHKLIRNLGLDMYELLIRNEVVHHFTLPNHERTSVHNIDNWLYDLEGQGQSPTPLETPPTYE